MRTIRTSLSDFPIVEVTIDGRINEADFRIFADEQRALLARAKPYAQIADASRAEIVDPRVRKLMSDFLSETMAQASRLCLGTAVVVTSPLIRGGLTAVLWLVQTPYPIVAVGSRAEAVAFCQQKLGARAAS